MNMITVSQNSTLINNPVVNGADFKSFSISHQSKPIAISLRKSKAIHKQKISPYFEIDFFDFETKFIFEIIEIKGELPSNEIYLYLKFNDNIIKATLSGHWQDNEGLYINDFGFNVEKQGETPTSGFLIKTLWAMLGLSSKVKIQIPDLKQKAIMSFSTNLNTISELLQIRQIAYRLMVIEKAFKIKLPFPPFIEGEDVENIAYCYHSVVSRNFEWFCHPAIVTWYATPEYFSLIPEENTRFPIQYGPEPLEKEIFGYRIKLGLQIEKVEEYILDNFDEVKNNLSKLDGREVLVQARSKNGVMQIESITTPHLPKNAFSHEIQKLIELEEKLDSIVLDKYFSIVASSLEGLTEAQKEAVLERPHLDEEAFEF